MVLRIGAKAKLNINIDWDPGQTYLVSNSGCVQIYWEKPWKVLKLPAALVPKSVAKWYILSRK